MSTKQPNSESQNQSPISVPLPSAAPNQYADIIQLERPISQKYPHMSIASRAAQFAPYKTIVAYHDQLGTADQSGNAIFQENEVIPDADYYEYEDNFGDFESVIDDSSIFV